MKFLFELLKEIARAVSCARAFGIRTEKAIRKKRQQKTHVSPTKVQAWI